MTSRRFQVIRSAEPAPSSVLDAMIDFVTPSSLDPRELLRDMQLHDKLKTYLEKQFDRYDVKLEHAVATDRYTPTERKFTSARGQGLEVAMLQIPKWIVSNGSNVGSIEEIRSAFADRTVRIVSPECDASSLGLSMMLEDWKTRDNIDARFIAWSNIKEMDKGYSPARVFQLELEELASSEPEAPVPEVVRNQVFISYSHRDAKWLERLQDHLTPLLKKLKKDKKLTEDALLDWDDRRIEPGGEWKQEIDEALAKTKVAVLLVSPAFLASKFITENELPPLLKAAGQGGARILWVLLSDCNYEAIEGIAGRQAAHTPLEPLDGLDAAKRNTVLKQISRNIRDALANEQK